MHAPQKADEYEDYAYVLAFSEHAGSKLIKGRSGPIVEAVGEKRFKLLELLASNKATFEVGERIYVGREAREKILSVLGRLTYELLSNEAREELPIIIETMVRENEKRFIEYFNVLQPLTPRLHALELIPGVGRKFRDLILAERRKKNFESFDELEKRVGLNTPAKLMAKRILDEITGTARFNIVVGRE